MARRRVLSVLKKVWSSSKLQTDNPGQTLAIKHGGGPALVYAGPGTGKTYVITHHILYLIEDLGISPETILVITFSKEAAGEMKNRFTALCPDKGRDVVFGTFHSVYYRILRAFGNVRFGIASDSAKRKIVSSVIEEDRREGFLDAVSAYKSGRPAELLFPDEKERSGFLKDLELYNGILSDHRLMDYDDILIRCRELLTGSPEVRSAVMARFSHILTDEFQDINGIQYEILKLMLREQQNIFAVGDENQSIYGFRGSKYGIFDDFLADFPDSARYRLGIDYRNHRAVFEAAAAVIGDKSETVCVNTDENGGFFLTVEESRSAQDRIFLKDLENELKAGKRCLIMARTNKDVAALESLCGDICLKYGHRQTGTADSTREILSLTEAMEALIEFCSRGEREKLFKILAFREDYLPKSLFTDETVDIDRIACTVTGPLIAGKLKRLKETVSYVRRCSAPGFVAYFRDIFMRGVSFTDHVRGELESLEKEAGVLKKLSCFREFLAKRTSALEAELEAGRDKMADNPAFLTFHASKGLEYDSVFIPNVIEGRVPKRNQLTRNDEEEERRLFYVAMTRARDRLFIYSVKSAGSQNIEPSRFLTDLLRDHEGFRPVIRPASNG